MDGLLRQMRTNFYDESQKDSFRAQQGRGFPEKRVSFSEDRRKTYDQNSKEEDSSDLEFMAAIAATAYAIKLAEEAPLGKKKPIYELENSLTKIKSQREDSKKDRTENNMILRWFSAKESEDVGSKAAGNIYNRKSSSLSERFKEENGSIKKAPTFSDKYLNETDYKPMPYHYGNKFQYGGRTKASNRPQNADDWEQAKMERIRKRHEKTNNTILQWENEKMAKAKHRVEKKERDLEKKRARILQEFREEMKRIGLIASGARSVADDARRSDELWAMKKAKRMRSTVKDRRKCFCF